MSSELENVLAVMRRLRDPERGCSWDRRQTPATLVRHTLEEAYEVADCIERGDWSALPGELGDLLFQVVFYAQIGAEQQRFDFEDVCRALREKLIRRHPQLFAAAEGAEPGARAASWEEIKAAERAEAQGGGEASLLDDVPTALPALTRAQKLQQRVARVGFDWTSLPPVLAKVREELEELESAVRSGAAQDVGAELGDLLFTCVNLARHLGRDAETALRLANRRFEGRFRELERRATATGRALATLDAAAYDALWEAIKRAEREDGSQRRTLPP